MLQCDMQRARQATADRPSTRPAAGRYSGCGGAGRTASCAVTTGRPWVCGRREGLGVHGPGPCCRGASRPPPGCRVRGWSSQHTSSGPVCRSRSRPVQANRWSLQPARSPPGRARRSRCVTRAAGRSSEPTSTSSSAADTPATGSAAGQLGRQPPTRPRPVTDRLAASRATSRRGALRSTGAPAVVGARVPRPRRTVAITRAPRAR